MHQSISLLALTFLLLSQSRSSQAELRTYQFTIHNGTRAPDGFPRQVYLINDQAPGPLIEVDEGDDLEVFVQNDLAVETTIHWHGILQQGTPHMDGVPGVTQEPIPPGGNFTYRFSLKNEYGFYWYHSHFRAYSDDSIRGPLVIHPSSQRPRPYETLARNQTELTALQEAEREAVPILLSDWYHRVSDDIFNEYLTTGAFPSCVDSLLANGYGRVRCLPEYILAAGAGLGMEPAPVNATATSIGTTPMSSMAMGTKYMETNTKESMRMESMALDTTSMEHHMRRMDSMSAEDMSMNTMTAHSTPAAAPDSGMPMSSMSMASLPVSGISGTSGLSGMSNMGSGPLGPRGCSAPMMFRPGYNISSLPPETCTDTSAPLLTVDANYTRGWLALNLVNSGSVTKLSVSLDAHSMFVYAADGFFVKPQEVEVLQISIGQRYSVMIKLNQRPGNYTLRFASYPYGDMQQVIEGQATVSYKVDAAEDIMPVDLTNDPTATWMLVNGSAKSNASELKTDMLAPFEAIAPPSQADITYDFTISQTEIVTWVLNGYPYSEPSTPIIYGNASEAWNANTTIRIPSNSTVDIIMRIANDSMDTMGHPMHLHGHRFFALGSGSGSFPYQNVVDAPPSLINLENPPYRDTTDLPPSGWAVIRYVANNPGAWMFHCHIQWHLVSGMALVFVEGEEQLPGLVGAAANGTSNANSASPARSTREHAAFAVVATLSTVFFAYGY